MKLNLLKLGIASSISQYKLNKNKNAHKSLKPSSKSNQLLKPTLSIISVLSVLSVLICLVLLLLSLDSRQSRKNKFVLVIVQNISVELSLLTEDFLHQLSRFTKKDDRFILEQARGNKVISLYSGSAKRSIVRTSAKELDVSNPNTSELEPVASTDTVFTAMVQRCADYVHKVATSSNKNNIVFHCFVISPGTNNQRALNKVFEITQNISKSCNSIDMHLHLVGLDNSQRLELTNYFTPLSNCSNNAEGIDFSSRLDEEWLTQIKSLK